LIQLIVNKNYRIYLHRDYLKRQREKVKMTIEEVGYKSNISSDYYAQIENGIRGKKMSVRLLITIANTLKLDLCTAIEGEREFIEQIELLNKKTQVIKSG